MLQFKDGRFHAHGVSFVFPEGFFLDTVPEVENECGIVTWSPDLSYKIELGFINVDDEPESSLRQYLSPGCDVEMLQKIKPLIINGLKGCCVSYKSGKDEYFETRFQVTGGVQLEIIVHTCERKIENIMSLPEIQTILTSIRAE